MQNVDKIADEIVRREGGYVNDPDDPGGATNFGVTIHTMRRLGLDLTGDGQVDTADVRRLTQAQAIDIFIRHYFEGPQIQKLPVALHATVFDMYVNAGANAVNQAVNSIAGVSTEIVGNLLDLNPTITVDQGTRINVFVNRDLHFPNSATSKGVFVE